MAGKFLCPRCFELQSLDSIEYICSNTRMLVRIPTVKHHFLSLHMSALGVERNTPIWFRVNMVF